jgi:hypothetical protein
MTMMIAEFLDKLDGNGLIITDVSLITITLGNMGTSYFDTIGFGQHEELTTSEEQDETDDLENEVINGCCECGSKEHICSDCPTFQ